MIYFQYTSTFRYESCKRFENEKGYGAKIVCKRMIKKGEYLKDLGGQCFEIHKSDIRIGVNDFAMVKSVRTKKDMLFLGPATYINHDCVPNCCWAYQVSKTYVHVRALKNIYPGEEITTYYGHGFFGPNNLHCKCISCEMSAKGAFSKQLNSSPATEGNIAGCKYYTFYYIFFFSL